MVPVYLIDYPVAISRDGGRCACGEAIRAGRAEVGVQLHPWVSPPHREEVNQLNSFAGNLPEDLERAKFMRLRDAIAENFGAPPRIYRAGRYGVGPNTAAILTDGGIAIDTSVRSYFDYCQCRRTQFPRSSAQALLARQAKRAHGTAADHQLLGHCCARSATGSIPGCGAWPCMRGVLSRLRSLERIPLHPRRRYRRRSDPRHRHRGRRGTAAAGVLVPQPVACPRLFALCPRRGRSRPFYDWWRQVFACLAGAESSRPAVAGLMDCVDLA